MMLGFSWCKSHPWLPTPCSKCGYIDPTTRCTAVSLDGHQCIYAAHTGNHRYARKAVK